MMKKRKGTFILIQLSLIFVLVVSFAVGFGCGSSDVPKSSSNYFTDRTLERAEEVNEETTSIFDERGLISLTNSIKSVTYNHPLSERNVVEGTGTRIEALSGGASFYFKNVVDLKTLNGADIINFEPVCNDEYRIERLDIELIDIYDETNVVKVFWYRTPNQTPPFNISYMLAEVNGYSAGRANYQPVGALTPEWGVCFYANGFLDERPTLELEQVGVFHDHFNFTYDYFTNEVLARVQSSERWVVMDVDSPELGANAFKGFTTGEVYVKVTFKELVRKGAIVVKDFAGRALGGEYTSKPNENIKLDVDSDYLIYALPNGVTDKTYKIPKPIYNDIIQGEMEVSCKLFKDNVDITDQVNNFEFTPSEAGTYVIKYETKDLDSLTVVKTLEFNVVETSTPISVNFDYDVDDFKCFADVVLPTPIVTGGQGKLDIKTEYIFNNEEIFPDKYGTYYFEESGELQVKTTITDYIGSVKTATETIDIEGQVSLVLDNGIPNAFVFNSTVTLPDFSVADYSESAATSTYNSNKKITVNGTVLGADRKYTVSNTDDIEITYSAHSGSDSISKTFNVKVINPANSDGFSGYLLSEGVSLFNDSVGIKVTALNESNKVALPFAVSSEMLLFSIETTKNSGSKKYNSYDYIQFDFYDGIEDYQHISFRLQDENGDTTVYINDGIGGYVKVTTLGERIKDGGEFNFYFINKTKTLTDGLNKVLAVFDYNVDGSAFRGFSSNSVKFEMSFGEPTAEQASIYLKKVSNQSFSKDIFVYGDLLGPEISYFTEFTPYSKHEINSTYVLSAAKAYDVLQYNSTITLTVTGPDRVAIFNNADISEDVELTFDKYGVYSVTYTAIDNVGKKTVYVFNFRVEDKELPTVEIQGTVKDTFGIGEEIVINDMVYSDNLSTNENCTVLIYVINPLLERYYVDCGDKFTFTTFGEYQLVYVVRDEAQNVTRVSYNITVK